MVRMNFIFVLPIKMAISPGAVTGGNLINLSAVEKTKRKNIIELQYCTGMSLFFFPFSKNRVRRVRKTKNKNK